MRVVRGYLFFGLAVLGLLALAEYRGWGGTPVRESRQSPVTVRDNPGAYRPHYIGTGRYVGGK